MKHNRTPRARQEAERQHRHEDLMEALHDIEQRIREMTSAIRELVKMGGAHERK